MSTPERFTALSLMKHRGPDDEGMVLIDSNTGEFEERGGEDTPQELGLADIHVPTTLKSRVVLGNRTFNH